MGTSGDRRIYVWWGAGFAFLALLAIFGWYFLRPYLEVRAAARRIIANKSSTEEDAVKVFADEVKTLGGPEKAAAKCALYVRLPKKLTTNYERDRAFAILGTCGKPAFPWAESLLHSRDGVVRAGAAWALGNLKDSRAVESLIGALKDSEADVRCDAAWGLGELKDPRAVEPLKALLADPYSYIRHAAEEAIQKIEAARTEKE